MIIRLFFHANPEIETRLHDWVIISFNDSFTVYARHAPNPVTSKTENTGCGQPLVTWP
jgi:hypothetical protein